MAEGEGPTYVALKQMDVHELNDDGSNRIGDDGRPVIRKCLPGDPIPEAVTWKQLWREVRAGRVGLAGTPFSGPALADSMRRQLADRAQRPKSEAEVSAGRSRDGRRRRAKQSREEQAAAAAVEQATGQEVVVGPGPDFKDPDASPQAVEAEEAETAQE